MKPVKLVHLVNIEKIVRVGAIFAIDPMSINEVLNQVMCRAYPGASLVCVDLKGKQFGIAMFHLFVGQCTGIAAIHL